MDDAATLTPDAAGAIARALDCLGAPLPGVPVAALVALAAGVQGRALTLDLASAALIGAPVLVLREGGAGLGRLAALSPREREVARLVAAGLPNKRIARELGIGLATVKDHVHHALARTGLPSRAALAAAAARAGL